MLTVLPPQEVLALEQQAFAQGVRAERLMEEAGQGMAAAIAQCFPTPGVCLAVFGKGHNGGDALVTARILSECGWRVLLFNPFPHADLAPLTAQKWEAAGRCDTFPLETLASWQPSSASPRAPLLLLDGLLGIGATGPLRNPIRSACRTLNQIRAQSHAYTIALDLPTGLDASTGHADPDAIRADLTLTVAFAKPGLLADGAETHVGRLALIRLLALEALQERAQATPPLQQLATPQTLAPLWKRRDAHLHKGDCGRVALLAGSRGCLGAAALCAQGALRAGAGLVTLWVPEAVYPLVAPMVPVECMVRPYAHPSEVLQSHADVLALGPGLGFDHPEAICTLIRSFPGPAVVDADALTLLASALSTTLTQPAGPRLLTPHPGEMERLLPGSLHAPRASTVRHFTQTWPVTLLLKGARTLIGTANHPLSYNTTGNPGMASGGMGDVLTGTCAGLLAQGISCHSAAQLGAWLCGRSAEIAVFSSKRSEESLLASDVAEGLGAAFTTLRARGF